MKPTRAELDGVEGYGFSSDRLAYDEDSVYVHCPSLCNATMRRKCDRAKRCCFSELLRTQRGQAEIYRVMGGKRHNPPHYDWSWGNPPRDVIRLLERWRKLRYQECRRVDFTFLARAAKRTPSAAEEEER